MPPGPVGVAVETSPVICQRCHRPFAYLAFEEISNLVQLRCGDLLIAKIEAACLHCGYVFHWGMREEAMRENTLGYKKLLEKISLYVPE